jgi:CelD/BcsL family acetyltransferase involved in cellulose biosynthesis
MLCAPRRCCPAIGPETRYLYTGMPAVRIEVVDALDPLVDEWRELAERADAAPFVYPDWFQAWWQAFGSGRFRIVTARRAGRLVALAPMQLRRRAWRSPTNVHTPAFEFLAVDGEARRELAVWLLARGAREVAISALDAQGPTLRALGDAAPMHGYRTVVAMTGRAPYVRLSGELPDHERSLSSNLRHDVQRRFRRLQELGAVSVHVADGREHLDDLLEDGFLVEQRSWKGRQGTAIISDRRTRLFYTALAHRAAVAGWLRLAFLRLDGQAIAFQLDLELRPSYYSLKIGYDPLYERFSPGKLLAYTMMSRAVATGFASYELLGTDEPWKHRWTHEAREQNVFRAFSPTLGGRLAWSAAVYGRPLARKLPFAARIAAAARR